MDDAKRQQLEAFLLLALHAIGDVGIAATSLLPRARLEVFRELTAPELDATLLTLADRRLVIRYQPALGGPRWKITGLGVAALQEQGLV